MKKLFLTTVIALLSMTGVMAEQYDFTADSGDNTLYYKITDAASTPKTVEVVSELECRYPDYKSYTTAPTGALTIPDSVSNDGTTYSVTSIGEAAFYDCSSLTGSLSIPNSVTSIGESAFDNCSGFDGSLTIGNSVTRIGDCAFDNCSGFKGSLTIGNSVTSIGDWAFRDCSGFTGSLTIPNSVTRIRQEAFNDCSGFDGSLTIGNSVTSIGDGAFAECSALTSLTMLRPTPPTTVGSNAFQNAGFSTVNVPAGAKAAYDGGDGDGEWKGFTIVEAARYDFKADSGDNTLYYKITDADAKTVEVVSELDYWDDSKAYNTAPKGTLTIPESVSNDDGTEYSVTSIEEWAFYDCSSFTGSLTIGNSVTRIGDYAFRGCSGFTGSLTIGNSVTNIGESAFCECSGFTGSLTIPNSVTSIGYEAFSECSGFTGSLTIPNSVTSIGSRAFYECSGFTGSLTIPNSVTSIGYDAFSDCSGFDGTLTIGSGLTEIDFIFNNLRFSEIKVNSANTAYSSIDGILYNKAQDELILCPGGKVGDVVVANKVKLIADGAFFCCRNIGSITLGTGIKDIAEYTFLGCKFNELTVLGTTPPTMELDYESPTFDFDALNARGIKVYVPCSSVEDYSTALGWEMFNHIYEIRPYRFQAISDNELKGTVDILSSSDCGDEDYTVTVEAVATSGYKFIRWNDGVTDAERTITLSQDSTILANFEVAYTIVYDANGGEGEMRSQNFAVERSHTLTRNAFTKAGTSFKGWSTTATGAVEYTDGEKVQAIASADEQLTLYAIWDGSSSLNENKDALIYTVNNGIVSFLQVLDLRVYNAQGTAIYAGNTDKVELPTSGVYIIQARTTDGWSQTIKVINR